MGDNVFFIALQQRFHYGGAGVLRHEERKMKDVSEGQSELYLRSARTAHS